MPPPAPESADHALRRYLDSGAPDALAELFDRAAEPLWRVALHLLGDASRAEDALQETFLAVIEARQRGGEAPPREALPWLTGILHNRVRRQRRDGARVADPGRIEESLDRLTAEDPLTAAERRDLVAAVERELHALPETYRPVLRLALQHGLAPHEIAATLERAPVTVRVQLSRGLALLRERLGPGLAGSLLAVGASLGLATAQSLPAIRSAVVEAARLALPAGAATATAGTVTLTALGTTLLMKKLALSIVALAAVAATVWALLDRAPASEQSTDSSAPLVKRRADAEIDDDAQRQAPDRSSPARRVTLQTELEEPSGGRRYGDVRVRVTWKDDGSPAPGIGLTSHCKDAGNAFLNAVEAVTDASGEALLARNLLGTIRVYGADHFAEVQLREPGEEVTLDLVATRHATVQGKVVDRDGQPVAGATIVTSNGFSHSDCYPASVTDAEGEFRVPFGRSSYIGARAEGHLPSHYFLLSLEPGHTETVTIPLRGPAGRLRGRVVDGRGEPIHGARVIHGASGHAITIPESEQLLADNLGRPQAASAPHPWLCTDAEGRFVLTGLAPGSQTIRARALDHGLAQARVEIRAGETAECEVALPTHAAVEGVVVGADGAPAEVQIVVDGARYGSFEYCATRSDPRGRYRLDSIPPGRISLRIHNATAGRAETELELEAGGTGTWNPRLVLIPSISGRVVDPLGTPMPGLRLTASNLDTAARNWKHAETDAEGRFVITGLRDELHDLEVFSPRCTTIACLAAGRATPGDPPPEITVDPETLPSAWIGGVLQEPDGGVPTGARLLLHHQRDGFFEALDPETGAFEIVPLPPCAVSLDVDGGRFGKLRLGSWDLEPHQTIDLGSARLQEPGALDVRLGFELSEGEHCSIQWTRPDGSHVENPSAVTEGRATIEPIAPGDYVVRSVGQRRSLIRKVTIESGRTTELVLPLDERPERPLTIHRTDPDEHGNMHVRVFDAAGTLSFESFGRSGGETEIELTIRTPEDGLGFTVAVFEDWHREVARRGFGPGEPLRIEVE